MTFKLYILSTSRCGERNAAYQATFITTLQHKPFSILRNYSFLAIIYRISTIIHYNT